MQDLDPISRCRFLRGLIASVAAAVAGCVWCKRITLHSETRETEEGPGHA